MSTSVGARVAAISSLLPGSNSEASRARARIAMWKSHFGQTSRFSSSSGRYSTAPQRSHFSHRPSGTLRLRLAALSVRMPEGISLLSQLIEAGLIRSGPSAAGKGDSLAHGPTVGGGQASRCV